MSKKFKNIIEIIITYCFYFILKKLPITYARTLGVGLSKIALALWQRINRITNINLKHFLPNSNPNKIINGMTTNIGLILGEMFHWPTLSQSYYNQHVKIISPFPLHLKNKAAILVSAHFGNWELAPRIFLEEKLNVRCVHRPLNNPYVNRLLLKNRIISEQDLIPKGTGGVKSIIKCLTSGTSVGMLVDQRHDDGEIVSFFGNDVRTTLLPANIAQKYNIPIVILRIQRRSDDSSCYDVSFSELSVADKSETPVRIMQRIYNEFENWIKEAPEQYFWSHRRMDKEFYKNKKKN